LAILTPGLPGRQSSHAQQEKTMTSEKFKDTLAKADDAAHQAADKAARATAVAYDDAKNLGRGVVRDMKAQAADAVDQASDGYDDLRDAASASVASAKAGLADGGDRLAAALHDAAEGSRHASARVIDAVAGGVSDMTDRLRGGSLSDLVSSTQAYAHRHPGAFAAGAAVAGFALARFLQASARKGPRG
jgi:hypothetical protein